MASRTDIEAGKAHVTLYAKDSPLMKGLAAVQGKMNAWGKGLMVAGGAIAAVGTSITGAFLAATAAFAKMGDELDKASLRTGIAVGSLAELKHAAEQSGTSLEAVERAILAMSRRGFDPKQFDQYAAEIAALPPGMEQIQRAMEVWGKSGAELIPMLKDLQALRKEARDLGFVFSAEDVANAVKLGDLWANVVKALSATMFNIGAALAPALIPMLEVTVQIAAAVTKWIQKNQGLVRIIAAIGAGLIVIGGIVATIGAGFVAIGTVIGAVSTALAALATPVGLVVLVVSLVALKIILLGTLIVAAAAYWLLFTESGRRCAKALTDAFRPFFNFMAAGFQGIIDALVGGDFELAYKIAATGMKVAFFGAIRDIVQKMNEIPMAFLRAMSIVGRFNPAVALAVTEAESILRGTQNSYDKATWDAMAELNELLLKAANNRKDLETGNEGQYDDSMGGVASEMKSLGSFNPYALTMQNWGTNDPQRKMLGWIRKLYEADMENANKIVRAIEDSGAKWGE